MSEATVDPYATTTTDTTDYSAEEVAAPEEEVKNPTILYFGWGVLNIWMVVLGFLIWGYYPGLMTSSTWWKQQCPSTAWTAAAITAAIAASTANCTTPTATCPTILLATNNAAVSIAGWTLDKCRSAAPISQWSTLAYTMMIGNGLMSLIWILNTIIGNNGGMLHMIFWRASQASALLVLLELVFAIMAMTSYGT